MSTPISSTTPSMTFPVGTVIEDPMAVMKILHRYTDTRMGHIYKVKVLQWKTDVPTATEQPDEIQIYVSVESLSKIKVIE